MKLNKLIILTVIFFFLFNSFLLCQDFKIINDNDDEPLIVGISTRDAYQDSNFATWFNYEYTNYRIKPNVLSGNKGSFEEKVIKIVLGSWCSDSKREVPRFVKILDFIEFPPDKILFINVDRNKKGLNDEVDQMNIEFVPTFIIYENGKEIGRIIETPIKSLEEDLIDIVSNTSQ